MPALAPRSCARCGRFACADHGPKAERRKLDEKRPAASARGLGLDWQRLRDAWLIEGLGLDPASPTYARDFSDRQLCAYHLRRGERVRDEAGRKRMPVDHIIPRSTRPDLRLEPANLQRLCWRCHDTKGLREAGNIPCTEHGQAVALIEGAAICRDCGKAAA